MKNVTGRAIGVAANIKKDVNQAQSFLPSSRTARLFAFVRAFAKYDALKHVDSLQNIFREECLKLTLPIRLSLSNIDARFCSTSVSSKILISENKNVTKNSNAIKENQGGGADDT